MNLKLLFSVLLLANVTILFGGIQTVVNNNDSGTGSLRGSIDIASEGDTIRFDENLIALGNDTIILDSEIQISKSLVIKGLYSNSDTLFIDGNYNRIFNVEIFGTNKYLKLDSMVLINGYKYNDNGGAVYINGSDSLIINNCILKGNRSKKSGGAIYASTTSVTVNNSIISNNTATNAGGGICCYSNSYKITMDLTINNSTLVGNSAGNIGGGGIRFSSTSSNSSHSIAITNSVFSKNTTNDFGSGGGIDVHLDETSSLVSFATSNCSFNENSAGAGGGICIDTKIPLVINTCTFYGNSAKETGGGAIRFYRGSDLTVKKSTFIENVCTSSFGGAIEFWNSTSLDINESTFYANSAEYGGALSSTTEENIAVVKIKNTTMAENVCSKFGRAIYLQTDANVTNRLEIGNSIIGEYEQDLGSVISSPNDYTFVSKGYNLFGEYYSYPGSDPTDQSNITKADLNLGPLQNNGGPTFTMLPQPGSVAIDQGDPNDLSDAQNGPVSGRRDIGSAEHGSVTSVIKKIPNNQISMYPNPCNGIVTVQNLSGSYGTINIFNSIGDLIRTKTILDYQNIDLREYSKGIYYVQILTEKGHYEEKMILSH